MGSPPDEAGLTVGMIECAATRARPRRNQHSPLVMRPREQRSSVSARTGRLWHLVNLYGPWGIQSEVHLLQPEWAAPR